MKGVTIFEGGLQSSLFLEGGLTDKDGRVIVQASLRCLNCARRGRDCLFIDQELERAHFAQS